MGDTFLFAAFIALFAMVTWLAIADWRRGELSFLRAGGRWLRNVIDLMFGLG